MEKKVYTDLANTPHVLLTNGVEYRFSTELHKKNFKARFEHNRIDTQEKLSKRYRFPVTNNLMADIYLYISIENRGFYIVDSDGRHYEWLEKVQLDGGKLTPKTYAV